MKIVIAGSRSFDDKEISHLRLIENLCKKFEAEYGSISMIVSGRARGPDRLGEQWANARNIPIAKFPAMWDMHGRAAGAIRNSKMGEFADGGIILWDGRSKGSKHMTEVLRRLRKPFILDIFEPVVYKYNHTPKGIINVVMEESPSLDDDAYDIWKWAE